MSKYVAATKDTVDVLDYPVRWGRRLKTDTIMSSSFAVKAGTVVIDSQLFDGTDAVVWLSGGTDGETAKIENVITTASGATHREVFQFPVVIKS